MTPYDIAILGGGPGGYVAALHAGIKGARVADDLGGAGPAHELDDLHRHLSLTCFEIVRWGRLNEVRGRRRGRRERAAASHQKGCE